MISFSLHLVGLSPRSQEIELLKLEMAKMKEKEDRLTKLLQARSPQESPESQHQDLEKAGGSPPPREACVL